MIFFFLSVLTNYLSVRVQGETVLKFNTAVLRCQVPQSAATYTKIISWTRGSTRLYPSTRGGNMTRSMYFLPEKHCQHLQKYLYNNTLELYIIIQRIKLHICELSRYICIRIICYLYIPSPNKFADLKSTLTL